MNNSKLQKKGGLRQEGILVHAMPSILTGQRIPKDYFVTKGKGESDITVHAGSYHLALREAGIEMCNIMTYSSILPSIATEIERPEKFGGNLEFDSYEELEKEFSQKKLHPMDLKQSTAEYLNKLIDPVRKKLEKNTAAKKLAEEISKFNVTR